MSSQRESLWASEPTHAPDPEWDEVFREPEAPEPEEPDGGAHVHMEELRAAATVLLGVLAGIAAVAIAFANQSSYEVDDVPSAWGQIPMTCHTARLEQDGRALELFNCRAREGFSLPPGLYESPDSLWTSDLTRIDAQANRIVIDRDGELRGYAVY